MAGMYIFELSRWALR